MVNAMARTRREILKLVGATGASSLAGMSVAGTALAADPTEQQRNVMPDSNFDPSRKQNVLEFVSDSFEARSTLEHQLESQSGITKSMASDRADTAISRNRNQLLKDLSDRQIQAISKVMEKSELVISRSSANTGSRQSGPNVSGSGSGDVKSLAATQSGWQFERFTGTIRADLQTPVGNYRAFRFEHEIEWEANHDWPADVRGMNATGRGNGKNYVLAYWDYRGATGDDIQEYTNYFLSEKTGKFKGCLLLGTSFTCSRNDRAYIECAGSAGGNGSVTNKYVN